MNRRQALAAAAVLPAAAAAPLSPDPTVDDLINLAERGSDPQYYGRVLAECLAETGTVAKDNGDGSISIYSPERLGAWTKRTVLSSVLPVPAGLLQRFKPANRRDGFPCGVPFRPLN
jgi:hypothetical protein